MTFDYDFDGLNSLLKEVLRNTMATDAWKWLETEGASANTTEDTRRFNIGFVAIPRKTGKTPLKISGKQHRDLQRMRPDLNVEGWAVDRLSRMWLLMQLKPADKRRYTDTIENLFLNAEMSELVALYSSLPVLAFPEAWRKRCAEGIRNNIGPVLESVICNNPYPSEQLDEAAWNQMVLKAIFTEKPMLQITGLQKRMNPNLALALTDYAHERWAAHRQVNPLLWICVAPFLNEGNFADIQRLFSSDDPLERQAAALACHDSAFADARRLLEQNPELKSSIESGKISWPSIASETGNP
jgi:hypothetical protein